MPFIPPIITAGASVLGGIATFLNSGTLLAGIAKAGLGLAAQYAVGQLLKPKRQAQATQLQTAYGEDLARSVILGRVGIAGHHIYRNAFGKGGRTIQDVYVLSHFRSAGIKRVRFQGEWRALAAASSEYGLRVEGTGEARIWVKLHAGTMGQAADPQLIEFSNPTGRWTAAHRLAGVSYAVVTYALDREHLYQPPELFAESEGAPLYDWRKDSSVGGSGAHRWADQSTWEFSTNPVLMMYALERGFFNGGELIVGKGVPAARLPLAEWTVAANICDETIEGKRRYQAALIAMAGQGSTHADNMQPLLDACAGSWVETAAGEFPIVGANQAVVASFGDDDIMPDESFRFSRKRSRSELVNTAAGTFVNPENFYEQSPLATRIDETALAVDGERLAVSISYGAVCNVEVGDRLLDIAIRASRYQANAEICLHPRFIRIQPGRWVRFNSAKHGDRKFLVLQKRLGAVGTNSARNVYLTLQEVGDGVFDPTAYVTVPPDIVVPGAANYLAEVQNFKILPNLIQDENGAKRPGARVQWDAIDDVTVTHVQLRYRPVAQPTAVFYDTDTADVIVRHLANGLTSNSNWEISSRLITRPSRTVAWSAWVPFTTLDGRFGNADVFDGVIDLKKLAQDVQELNQWIGNSGREWQDRVNALATLASDLDLRGYDDKESLRREIAAGSRDSKAQYTEAIAVATGPNSAMGIRMELVEASVAGKASARSLDILNAQVFGNTGVASRISAVEVTIPNLATVSALDALETSIGSDMSLLAGRTSTVEARQNGDSANSTFKMTAGYTAAAGWSARIGMQARIDANGTTNEKLFKTAGFFLDVNASSARAVFDVNQFVIMDSTSGTNLKPFIFSGGEAYME
ncbi:hypothetical protein AB4144_01425, partial [Rhizobiaceae sp. 2RAB30]